MLHHGKGFPRVYRIFRIRYDFMIYFLTFDPLKEILVITRIVSVDLVSANVSTNSLDNTKGLIIKHQ